MSQVSDCCGAPVRIQGGATQWWRCVQCSNACNLAEAEHEPRHARQPARCMGCESDIWPLPNARRHDDGSMMYEDSTGILVCQKATPPALGEPLNFIYHKPLPEKI